MAQTKSARGHPTRNRKAIVRDDCSAERLPLITGGEPLTPVKIKTSDLIINKSSIKQPSTHSAHSIVWLEK